VTDPDSIKQLRDKLRSEIHKHQPETPVILVGLKQDLRSDKNFLRENPDIQIISPEKGEQLAKTLKCIMYLEISSKSNYGLDKSFYEKILNSYIYFQAHRDKKKNKKCIIC
jgi:Rho family protein